MKTSPARVQITGWKFRQSPSYQGINLRCSRVNGDDDCCGWERERSSDLVDRSLRTCLPQPSLVFVSIGKDNPSECDLEIVPKLTNVRTS